MATLSITVPDAQAQRVFTAFAQLAGVDPTSITTGAAQLAFVKQKVCDWIISQVQQVEGPAAGKAAAATAQQNVISQIPLS